MTVLSTLTFDAIAEGAAVTVSSPWSRIGTAPTALAAASQTGARGARYDTSTSGRLEYDYGSNQTTGNQVIGFDFRINSHSGSPMYMAGCFSLATGGTEQGSWRVDAAGTVTIRNGTSAVNSPSSATLSDNTWYHAEWMVSDAANSQTLRIYPVGSSTLVTTLTGAWSSVLTRVLSVGPHLLAAGGVADFDNVTISDDWIYTSGGPTVTTEEILFDALADAHTLVTGDLPTGWSVVTPNSPVVKTTSALHGARGINYASTGTSGRVQRDYGASLTSTLMMSMYFRITTMASVSMILGSVIDLPTGGQTQADWRVNTDRTVTLRRWTGSAMLAVASSTTALALNTWYRAAWKMDPVADTQALHVYAGESSTDLFTALSGAFGTGALRVATLGPSTAAAGGVIDIDTIRLATDYLGPYDTTVHRPWHRRKTGGVTGLLIPHKGL